MRAALLIALVACKGDPARAPEKAQQDMPNVERHALPPPTASAAKPDPAQLDLPRQESLTVLDAGTGDKTELRYRWDNEEAPTFVAETQLTTRHLEKGALSEPAVLPAIRDGFVLNAITDHADGFALRAVDATAVKDTPETDAYLGTWRTLLQRRRITIEVDAHGQLGKITFMDDPGNARGWKAHDELAQRLLSTVVPVPDKPVGAGATWKVVTILRQGPVYAKQIATYKLLSRGATWKVHAHLERVAEQQRFVDDTLPKGVTADLQALVRILDGDLEVDPAHPLVIGGEMSLESRLHVQLSAANQPTTEQILEDTGHVVFSLAK
jgi:hypothetical protein